MSTPPEVGGAVSFAAAVPSILEEPQLGSMTPAQFDQWIMARPIVSTMQRSGIGLDTERMRKVYDRAVERFMQRRIEAFLEHQYMQGDLQADDELTALILEKATMAEAVAKNTVFSVCVRPKEVADVEQFILATHRHARSKLIGKASYCFETATDDGTMQGVHVHMLITTRQPTPKSTVKQRFAQCYRRFGLVNIDVQSLRDETKIKNTEAYIGKLPGEGSSKHTDDISFREKYNLEHRYEVQVEAAVLEDAEADVGTNERSEAERSE